MVTWTSNPSRRKKLCGLTLKVMIRSPGFPPRLPRSPFPDRRTFDPASTPFGTVILNRRFWRTVPLPLQALHGDSGISPRPKQAGHGRFTAKPPWPKEIEPVPLHSLHFFASVPGDAPDPSQVAHSSVIGTSMEILPPLAAVRKEISTEYSILRPFAGPFFVSCAAALGRRSKMELKMSPRPPNPSRSSKENPPPPSEPELLGAPRPRPNPRLGIRRIWS